MLRSIGYVSTAAKNFSEEEIPKILSSAINWNTPHNITGILCYNDGNFLQFIEGEDADIAEVFNIIYNDKRHYDIMKIFDESIQQRVFPDWRMALRRLDQLPQDLRASCRNLMSLGLPKSAEPVDHRADIEALLYAFKLSLR